MKYFFFWIAPDFSQSILDVGKLFHPFQAYKDDIALKVLHNMSRMEVSEEKSTLMHKL